MGDKKCCSCRKSSDCASVVALSSHDNVPCGPNILSTRTGKKLWSSNKVPLSSKTVNSAHLVRIGRLNACWTPSWKNTCETVIYYARNALP